MAQYTRCGSIHTLWHTSVNRVAIRFWILFNLIKGNPSLAHDKASTENLLPQVHVDRTSDGVQPYLSAKASWKACEEQSHVLLEVGAVTIPSSLLGQQLSTARQAGTCIFPHHLQNFSHCSFGGLALWFPTAWLSRSDAQTLRLFQHVSVPVLNHTNSVLSYKLVHAALEPQYSFLIYS